MFTRRHYETVAQAVRFALSDREAGDFTDGVLQTALQLSDKFAADNPRFDRTKFLRACGFVNDGGWKLP